MVKHKFHEELKRSRQAQNNTFNPMAYPLYSHFTKFFVRVAFDMVANAKIYETKEFFPLQINVMKHEALTSIKAIAEQDAKRKMGKWIDFCCNEWRPSAIGYSTPRVI